MDVITKLIKFYNEYLNNQKQSQLAKSLLLNIYDTVPNSIYELAEKCYTSPSAISRFMKVLEYTGFSQYKYFVQDTLNSYSRRNRVVPISETRENSTVISDYVHQMTGALKQFQKNVDQQIIDEICRQIDNADNVLCVSPEIGVFTSLQYDLIMSGKTSRFPYGLAETEEYLKAVDDNTFAIVFISPERESTRMSTSLDVMRTKGIPSAMLASKDYIKADEYSDLVIKYSPTNTNLDNVIYNAFIDVITMTYRKNYIEKFRKWRKRPSARTPEGRFSYLHS